MQSTIRDSLRHQPKTQEVCARLTLMAHELGPDAKFPTVLNLRDEMGVSLGTLNSAMKVLEANNVIYRIQGIGVFVSPSLQRQLSLICTPEFFNQVGTSPFWQLMIDGSRERAKAKNEAFSYHFSVPDGHKGAPLHAGLARDIETHELHGVLGIGLDRATADWIEERGVPYVAFAGPARWIISLDSKALIQMGIEELVVLGCKRIGYWNPGVPTRRTTDTDMDIAKENEKNAIWRASLVAHGLEPDETLLHNRGVVAMVDLSHQEQGFHLAQSVFSAPRSTWPDGILCGDDVMTHGALLALDQLGVRVGQDVQIASHSNRNSTVLMGRESTLTRLEYDPAEVVRAMFDTLETVMDGGEPAQSVYRIQPVVCRRAT